MTTLNDISAADFLSLVQTGEVDLADYLAPESDDQEKLASSLSEMSDEDLLELLEELESDSMDKEAGAFDLNDLSVDEFIEFAAHLEEEMEMDKEAGAFDLNELSVDEFLHFAANLEEEMEKEAMMAGAKKAAKKYIPGVRQMMSGNRKAKKLSKRMLDMTPEELAKTKKVKRGDTIKDMTMQDRLDEANLDTVVGGAKAAGTGVGVVGGMYGLKKMLN